MSLSPQKSRWWYALAMGLGATGFFVMIYLDNRPFSGRERWLYLWPVCAAGLCFVAARKLRSQYRLEPAQRGGWQLSLGELVALMLLLGTVLTIFQAADPEHVLRVGLPVTLCGAVCLLFGLLAAKRAGFVPGRGKACYALGAAARLYGTLGLGALGTCTIVVLLFNLQDPVHTLRFLGEVFFLDSIRAPSEAWLMHSLRTGWICFGLSYIFFWLAALYKLDAERASQPPSSPAPPLP